ncbi:hypothetical protein [Streptomyces sp. bgisy027]|uniref:hypothetical protein n=1 Tax=Streptomyces sp. bgisy027 TaxID=3413770 RepID=UPI003D7237B9
MTRLDHRQVDLYASGGVLLDLGEQEAVAGLCACARPELLTDWRTALRRAARDWVRDMGGCGLVLLVVVTAALCAWNRCRSRSSLRGRRPWR